MATIQGNLAKPVSRDAFATQGGGNIIGQAKPLVAGATPGASLENTLQTIISKGGPTAASAQQLLQQLQQNPGLANDPGFQDAVNKTSNAAVLGQSAGAKATGLAPKVANATTAGVQNYTTNLVDTNKSTAITNQQLELAKQAQQDNQAYYDKTVAPLLPGQQVAASYAGAGDVDALEQQKQSRNQTSAALNNLIGQQTQNAAAASQRGNALTDTYTQQQNQLNAQDQGTYSKYLSETDPLMSQMSARGWGADVQNDPEGLAAQRNALSMAQGAANGSLDYNAAQWQSNPEDAQRQEDAYSALTGVGRGSLDYASQAARAFADPTDVGNQRQALSDIVADLHGGDANQQDAYNTIKSRTGVEATAQEAFLAEQARRKFENDDRSSREAVMQDLAQRGLRSGSAEIANQLANREQSSQDRTLAELGLQAGAVQRAQAYTGMQANQANQMRNSQQQGLGLESNLSTNLRNASFDEAYKRGVGADTASANNQQTRFGGITGSANEANAIRNADDSVGTFNTGQTNVARANNQSTRSAGISQSGTMANSIRTANDAIATFNKTGSQAAQQYQDTYAQNEAIRTGNLAGTRASTGLATTAQVGGRNDATLNAGINNNNTNYTRENEPINNGMQAAKDIYTMDTGVNNMQADVGQRAFQRSGQIIGTNANATAVRNGQASTDLDRIIQQMSAQKGDLEAKRAEAYY